MAQVDPGHVLSGVDGEMFEPVSGTTPLEAKSSSERGRPGLMPALGESLRCECDPLYDGSLLVREFYFRRLGDETGLKSEDQVHRAETTQDKRPIRSQSVLPSSGTGMRGPTNNRSLSQAPRR